MFNPLKVSLDNIIPLTEARDHFSQIVSEVQKDKLYVLTKGGKPAVAIIDVKYLERITGGEITGKAAAQEEHTPPPPPAHPEPKPIMPEPEPFKPAPPPPPPITPEPTITPEPITPPVPSITPPPAPPISPVPPTSQPLHTPPVEPHEQQINVQMTPDGDDTQKNAALDNSFAVPEDKPLPGQYDGKTDDMPID